jgi:hypothetical protein
MKITTRRCLLLLALGLSARPAYALGDQINVFIYAGLAIVGLGAVGLVMGVVKLARLLFPKRPPQRAQPVGAPAAKDDFKAIRLLFILVGVILLYAFVVSR